VKKCAVAASAMLASAMLAAALLPAPQSSFAADPPAPAALPVAAAAPASDCAAPDSWVVGPRTQGRLLPLLSGDSARGFKPACTLPWSAISPKNTPLAIAACFRGGLLQIDTDAVCGAGKGKLWISSRWVITTAKPSPKDKAAGCQQLETGAYAATRALPGPCVPASPAK
jgi:hypothetical protein